MGITKGRNDSSDLGVYPWFQLNFNSLEIMFIKYHHDVKSNMLKSYFLGQCSFTQRFHDVEQLRRKPKIFVKVIWRFWYAIFVGLIFFYPPEAAKFATLVTLFNVGKT